MIPEIALAAAIAIGVLVVAFYARERDARRASRRAFGMIAGAVTVSLIVVSEAIAAIGSIGEALSEVAVPLAAVAIGALGYGALEGIVELAPQLFATAAAVLIVVAIMIREAE